MKWRAHMSWLDIVSTSPVEFLRSKAALYTRKYVLEKVVDGGEDKDGPTIIPLANTSYFLGKLLTKKKHPLPF